MAGPNRIDLEIGGEDRGASDLLNKLKQQVADLESLVELLGKRGVDLNVKPAETAIKELEAEFRRLESAFDRAERALSFARTRNEIEQTSASARRLANAEAVLAARGKDLIDFSRRLPPELAKDSAAMDRLEKQTEQAAAAFRTFQASTTAARRGLGDLVSGINGLRAGLAGIIAALGVQQLLRFGRALIDVGQASVETKLQFDRLIPGLKAFAGSTELANEIAARLAGTADRLKTPLAGLVDPFLAIQAGGREAGLSISEISDLFEQSLTSARAFGKGADEVQRLLTGISQVAGKGVASMEEFRQQIGESIPNAIPALAKGLSLAEGRIVTTAEAIARISSGSLDSATALRALTAGFEALNAAAAAEQLQQFQGVLGALGREAEKARGALADGFTPGLRDLLETVQRTISGNEELIKSIGGVAGAGLKSAADLLEVANALKIIATASADGRERVERFFDQLGEGVKTIPGLQIFSEAIKGIGGAFSGATEEAKKAFQEIEDRQRQLVLGSNLTAEEILESFRKSFEEQARAAGAANDEIEQASKDLADAVGDIAEKSQKEREALEAARVKVAKGTTEQITEFERLAAEEINRIEREAQAEREQLLKDLVESTKRATDERIRLESEAAAKARAEAEKILEKAHEIAEERIAIDESLAGRVAEIEAELAEKLLRLQEEFVEKLKKPKADRAKLEEEFLEKAVAAERDAAEKIRAELEKVAKAAEEVAERRRKAELAVQKAYDDSIDKLRELVATLDEAAQGSEGEGGALGQVADDAARAKDEVDGLDESLGGLLTTLEEINAGNIGDPLASVSSSGLDLLGSGAKSFFQDAAAGAADLAAPVDDFADSLLRALDAAKGLSGGARDAVLEIVARYADLAGAGQATAADARSFADELAAAFQGLGTSLDDPVIAIQERLQELQGSQSEAAIALEQANVRYQEALQASAEAAGVTAEASEDAGERAKVAFDPVTRTMENVEEAAGEAADAVEEAGQRIERTADGITVTNEALEGTEQAGETAAQGLQAVGEAAGAAATALADAGAAAEPLKGEIVGEGEPDKLRDLGTAAGEAFPAIQPLAEPVQALATASQTLSESLPVIAEQIPVITATASELLTLLGESDVDFTAISELIAGLQEPLNAIATSLPVIQLAVSGLPEPIKLLQEAAAPLFELVAEVAEDDRFGKWGAGLAAVAAPLPSIPEPLAKIQATLEKLVAQKDDITATLTGIADGLTLVAAAEILAGLKDLTDSLEELLGLLKGLDESTKSWKSTLDQIVEDMPELLFSLGDLSDRLQEDVVPAMDQVSQAADQLRQDLGAVKEQAETVFPAVRDEVDKTTASIAALREEIQGATADANELAAALTRAAEAGQSVTIPAG